MDLTPLHDADRLIFDDPITVTLIRPASFVGGAETAITVDYVQRQAAQESEVDSPMGGSLEGTSRAWRMWLVECANGTMPPHKGYLVREPDNSVWEVTSVDRLCEGREFRVHGTQRPT